MDSTIAHQTRLAPEDWKAFWKWECGEDKTSKMLLAYGLYGLLGVLFVVGLLTDKNLAIATVGAAVLLGAVIGIAFQVNRFARNRLMNGEPVVTLGSSGYRLGKRCLPWPLPPLAEIRNVSAHDFQGFLVLAIDVKSRDSGVQHIHIPFCVKDRELRSYYVDELRRRAGLGKS